MSVSSIPTYFTGTAVELETTLTVDGVPTNAVGTVSLEVVDPEGNITTPTVTPMGSGRYTGTALADVFGHWHWRWLAEGQSADEGEFWITSEMVPGTPDLENIRVAVPRIRRAVEGVVKAQWLLADDEVKDLCADAIADIILYSGNIFGKTLNVLARDPVTGAPTEYSVTPALGLPEETVIAAQAALNYFFHRFSAVKVSETIADEASNWSYDLSPNLLVAQLKQLQSERDKALTALETEEGVLESYHSFIAVRDTQTSRYIEPWVYGHSEGLGVGAGGLEGDFRFDSLATGGGDFVLGAGGTP